MVESGQVEVVKGSELGEFRADENKGKEGESSTENNEKGLSVEDALLQDMKESAVIWSTDKENEGKKVSEVNGSKKTEESTTKTENPRSEPMDEQEKMRRRLEELNHISTEELERMNHQIDPVMSLDRLLRKKVFRDQILPIVKRKFPDASIKKVPDVINLLKPLNIEIESIGTDEVSFHAWLKTLEECR